MRLLLAISALLVTALIGTVSGSYIKPAHNEPVQASKDEEGVTFNIIVENAIHLQRFIQLVDVNGKPIENPPATTPTTTTTSTTTTSSTTTFALGGGASSSTSTTTTSTTTRTTTTTTSTTSTTTIRVGGGGPSTTTIASKTACSVFFGPSKNECNNVKYKGLVKSEMGRAKRYPDCKLPFLYFAIGSMNFEFRCNSFGKSNHYILDEIDTGNTFPNSVPDLTNYDASKLTKIEIEKYADRKYFSKYFDRVQYHGKYSFDRADTYVANNIQCPSFLLVALQKVSQLIEMHCNIDRKTYLIEMSIAPEGFDMIYLSH